MQSLAVKYRPMTFDEIVGQNSIKKILQRQLERKEYTNVYLFAGASGCGKTTIARAFARAINNNCGTPIEIDAASNNGVDNIRDIINSAKERSIDSVYKIYIIDEVHALSNSAWQAMLKLIEEPPTYTIFMLATTDPQKIPNTILNRVMRFNLTRISSDKIKDRLIYICKQEKYSNYEETCDYISKISNNQMRDAIATLEKCATYNTDLCITNAMEAIGNYSYNTYIDLINYLIDGNNSKVIKLINQVFNQGNDMKLFIEQFLSFALDICKYCICDNDISITKFPTSISKQIESITNFDKPAQYYCYLIDRLLELKNMLKTDMNAKDTVEVYMIKLGNYQ